MPGQIEFEVIENWEKLPDGWNFVEVAGVATDSNDNVYVFNRSDHPMMIFDPDGNFLEAWGEGVFTNPHGIHIGPDDTVYCCDNFDHTVRIFTKSGSLLRTLGTKDQPSDTGFEPGKSAVQRGGGPFNMVTNAALSAAGDLYVSDGYGNARVHKFDPKGEHQFSWGEPGSGPGEFDLPHAIAVDRYDRVYVADRENSRIQIFDLKGQYIEQWNNIVRPDDLFIDAEENLFVAELGERAGKGPNVKVEPHTPYGRVTVLSLEGEVKTRIGTDQPTAPGSFFAPHGLWADSNGALYVGEVTVSGGGRFGLVPMDCHSLQKFLRIRG